MNVTVRLWNILKTVITGWAKVVTGERENLIILVSHLLETLQAIFAAINSRNANNISSL